MKKIKHVIIFSCFTSIIAGIFILLIASQSMATTFCVANEADLIAALNEAKDNGFDDVIKLQQGTYYGNFVYASTESSGVTIEGGYSDALCIERDVNRDNTVLDGQNGGPVLVLSAPEAIANFVVEGLTIQNGLVTGLTNGGGIFVSSRGSFILANNSIKNNYSGEDGGGVYISVLGTATLSANLITENLAGDEGGGVYAVYPLLLTNNVINNNSANRYGGGIWGSGTMDNNMISNNTGSCGGGIYTSGNLILNDNIIINNVASADGGGVCNPNSNTTMTNNIINFNTAGQGGGFNLYRSNRVTLINNIICSNNGSWQSGGAWIYEANIVTLTNNTICYNSTGGQGGGIWLRMGDDGDIASIYNNVIWHNSGADGADLFINNDPDQDYIAEGQINILHNDFDQSSEGTYIQISFTIDSSNLDNEDPAFVPTIDDYHLTIGSPCINAGNNGAPELPLTDKDGYPRKVGSDVDIGAYEYQGFVAPVAAFMASPLAGVTPLTVEFSDESTGTIDTWYWDFGDGGFSSLQNPIHTYDAPGIYTVRLTATGDSFSDTKTMMDYITVVSPDAPDLNCRVKEFHSYEFGERVVVKLQVENTGNSKSEGFDVYFYLFPEAVGPGELIAEESVNGGINSDHSKVVQLRYESLIPLSGNIIKAVIDPNQQVIELDETNNTANLRIP